MNISTRLEKLEKQADINSQFCQCFGADQMRVVTPHPTGDACSARTIGAEETCERCGKPKGAKLIAVDPLRPSQSITRVIYPHVEMSREEFGAWQDRHVTSVHQTYEQFLADMNHS